MPFYSGVLRVGWEAVRKPDKQQSDGGFVLGERGEPQPRFVSRQERVGAPDRKYWHGECITCCSKHSSTIRHQTDRTCALETLSRGCRLFDWISNFIDVFNLVQYFVCFCDKERRSRSKPDWNRQRRLQWPLLTSSLNQNDWKISARSSKRICARRKNRCRTSRSVTDWNIFDQVQ